MKTTWRSEVETALSEIGGQGSLENIYAQIKKAAQRDLPPNWQAIVRSELEYNSSDSKSFQKRHDLFYSVKGIGSGIWGLRSIDKPTPVCIDANLEIPKRIATQTFRILRDTLMSRRIKSLHQQKCQLCGTRITLPNGQFYSEGHHIRPLGEPYNGPDIPENILVLCPNHHVMCDYGAMKLSLTEISTVTGHVIANEYIDYHNEQIFSE